MHLQNLPINRFNPSPETTISQVTTYYTASVHHIKRYIHSYIFHCSSVFLQQCKHCCLHQNHISVQPCIKDTRFAGVLRCLRANSTHLHFAFAQKIERAAKSATLPYAFYIFGVLIFSFVVWFTVTPFRIFIHQWDQILLHPVRFNSSMGFFILWFYSLIIINGVKEILSIEDYIYKLEVN